MNIKGLGHIALYTKSIEDSLSFYKLLGFKLDTLDEMQTPNGILKLALISAGNCIIELLQYEKSNLIDSANHGFHPHVCYEVENIEEFVDHLKANGVTNFREDFIKTSTIFGGIKNIFFFGPNGELIELIELCQRIGC